MQDLPYSIALLSLARAFVHSEIYIAPPQDYLLYSAPDHAPV